LRILRRHYVLECIAKIVQKLTTRILTNEIALTETDTKEVFKRQLREGKKR